MFVTSSFMRTRKVIEEPDFFFVFHVKRKKVSVNVIKNIDNSSQFVWPLIPLVLNLKNEGKPFHCMCAYLLACFLACVTRMHNDPSVHPVLLHLLYCTRVDIAGSLEHTFSVDERQIKRDGLSDRAVLIAFEAFGDLVVIGKVRKPVIVIESSSFAVSFVLFAEFKGNAGLVINVSMGVNKKLQNSYSPSHVKCTC